MRRRNAFYRAFWKLSFQVLIVLPAPFLAYIAAFHFFPELADSWHRGAILIACLLPIFLGLMASRLVSQTRALDFPRLDFDGTDTGLPLPDSLIPLYESEDWALARQTLLSEMTRTEAACANADLHANIWGSLGTVSLSMALIVIKWGAGTRAVEAATAAVAAVAVSLLLGFAQVLVRSAARDASTRMFSCASRELLVSGVASVIATILLTSNSELGALGIGLCAGLLGPRALLPLQQRAASVLGAKLAKDTNQLPVGMIEGLTDDIVVRLAEEGLDSVHALAFTNTPRIFFSTPYSWEQICDWQAQAVLLEQLGLARFAKFKEQFPIRGVQEAIAMLEDQDTLEKCAKVFNLGKVEEVTPVIEALRSSHSIRMLCAYAKYGDLLVFEAGRTRELSTPPSLGSSRPPLPVRLSDFVPRNPPAAVTRRAGE